MAVTRPSSMLFKQPSSSPKAELAAKDQTAPKELVSHQKEPFQVSNGTTTLIAEVSDQAHTKLLIAEQETITLVNLSTHEQKPFPIACGAMAVFPQGCVAVGMRNENVIRIYASSDLENSRFETYHTSSPVKHFAVLDQKRILIITKNNEARLLNIQNNKFPSIFSELPFVHSLNILPSGEALLHLKDNGTQKIYRLRFKPYPDFSQIDLAEEINELAILGDGKIVTLPKHGDKLTLWEIQEPLPVDQHQLDEDKETPPKAKFHALSSCGSTKTIGDITFLQTMPYDRYLVGFDSTHFTLRFWEVTDDNKLVEKHSCKLPENENYLRSMRVLEDGSIALVTRNFLMNLKFTPQQELQENLIKVNAMVRSEPFRGITSLPIELRHLTATYLFREVRKSKVIVDPPVTSTEKTCNTP